MVYPRGHDAIAAAASSLASVPGGARTVTRPSASDVVPTVMMSYTGPLHMAWHLGTRAEGDETAQVFDGLATTQSTR